MSGLMSPVSWGGGGTGAIPELFAVAGGDATDPSSSSLGTSLAVFRRSVTVIIFIRTWRICEIIFYGVVCWSSSSILAADRRRLDKLIKKASSTLGCPLDSVQVVGESRMMDKPLFFIYFCYWFLFCKILPLLGQTNFPVCGTLKDSHSDQTQD